MYSMLVHPPIFSIFLSYFFFFNDTATTEIYTLSLHDALPISKPGRTPAAWSSSREAAALLSTIGLSAPSRLRRRPRHRVEILACHVVRRQLDLASIEATFDTRRHEPSPEEHHRVGNRVGGDGRDAV